MIVQVLVVDEAGNVVATSKPQNANYGDELTVKMPEAPSEN